MNAADTAAIEAIDLTTYNGEDPCLIHEPFCQNCGAKQSETDKQLTRCAGCSLVWYCSNECVQTDLGLHGLDCRNMERNRKSMMAKEQDLHQKHQIMNPYVPRKSIPRSARAVHEELQDAVSTMKVASYEFACEGDSKELWEMTLAMHQKAFKMWGKRWWMAWVDDAERLSEASKIAFILIRLDRLEDAWRFIRNTMATYKSNEPSTIVIEYEPQDRFTDCFEWVRSSYPHHEHEIVRKNFHVLILGLIIIKLRIRAAAARNAWRDTINKVFLETKQGKELEPVKFALEEWFSLSDNTTQLEHIRQLMATLDCFEPSLIRMMLNPETAANESLGNAFTCLHRTPKGPELLSFELSSAGFTQRVEQLTAIYKIPYLDKLRQSTVRRVGGFIIKYLIGCYGLFPLQSGFTQLLCNVCVAITGTGGAGHLELSYVHAYAIAIKVITDSLVSGHVDYTHGFALGVALNVFTETAECFIGHVASCLLSRNENLARLTRRYAVKAFIWFVSISFVVTTGLSLYQIVQSTSKEVGLSVYRVFRSTSEDEWSETFVERIKISVEEILGWYGFIILTAWDMVLLLRVVNLVFALQLAPKRASIERVQPRRQA